MPRHRLSCLLGLLLSALPLAATPATPVTTPAVPDTLQSAIAAPDRTPKFVARDSARHPYEVLSFLGVTPDASVAEIYPGGGYWTEILAPYLHDRGHLVEVLGDPTGTHLEQEFATLPAPLQARVTADPARFGAFTQAQLGRAKLDFLPPASVDAVLTFRNLHNWLGEGDAPAVLAAFHRVLKPGGILGIEDHRARPDRPQDPKAEDGYVRQDYAIALVEQAGFKLVASSEIERNPRDTTHWPEGVWTLPPSFALKNTDRAKYAAIGEADNFLLKFQKVD